jgi:hypothetical protein
MTAQPDSQPLTNEALERLINVEAALDRLTAALVTGRPDAVLAAEEALGSAARQLASYRPAADADPAELADKLHTVRVAVLLCERLGRASAALIQATVAGGPYAANGQLAAATVPATVVSRT